MNTKYEKILEPGRIGSVKTRNRIVKTGAGMLMWHQDDVHMRPEVLAFYEGMARGGVGLLIVESPTIDYPRGRRGGESGIASTTTNISRASASWSTSSTNTVVPTFMQMNHDGPWQVKLPFEPEPLCTTVRPIAASAVSLAVWKDDFHKESRTPLTIPEIEEIVGQVRRRRRTGAEGGLRRRGHQCRQQPSAAQFPLSLLEQARRTSTAGASKTGPGSRRIVIREIKKRAETTSPVSVYLNGIEIGQVIGVDRQPVPDPRRRRGNRPAACRRRGRTPSRCGATGWGITWAPIFPTRSSTRSRPYRLRSSRKNTNAKQQGVGANIPAAAGIKRVVSIPVTVVGRLDADLGEQILREGKADFIGMTTPPAWRPRLPEQDWLPDGWRTSHPARAATTAWEDAGAESTACWALRTTPSNKAAEEEKSARDRRRPGGMEAARVSALRGHDVTLYEKSTKLGGLLPLAAIW